MSKTKGRHAHVRARSIAAGAVAASAITLAALAPAGSAQTFRRIRSCPAAS
jgi:hypothetical protein